MLKKSANIFVILICIILTGIVIYKNGLSIKENTSRMDEIPVHNEIYMLDTGKDVEQIFMPQNDYLVGVDLLVVNTSTRSSGELVVQLRDMYGDTIIEKRQALASLEPGVYQRIEMNSKLDIKNSEEFLIRIYAEGANIIPGVICVSDSEDVEENGLCYYVGDRIDNSLAIGYVYGEERFTGYQYWERVKIQMAVAETMAIILIGAILIYAVNTTQPHKIKRMLGNVNIYYQLTIICLFFSAFFLSAIINKVGTDVRIPAGVYLFLIGTVLLLLMSVFLYVNKLKFRAGKRRTGQKSNKKVLDYPVIIIIIFSIITRLPMFTQIQRWDGSVYYSNLITACNNFDFTFSSVWNYFKLASHPTLAYTFFLAIGEFLMPARVTGPLIILLILTIAALICIYKMLRGYWCHMSEVKAMAVVFLISLIPIFWGTFSYINVDYTLIVFFIFMLYADYKDQKILKLFWMMTVLLNKETGWAIIAGYFCAYFIGLWREVKGEKLTSKFKRFMEDSLVRIMIFCGIVIVFYIIKQGSLFTWMGTGTENSLFVSWAEAEERGLGVNAIGVYPQYILHKLAQIFILNFMWIPSLVILVSCILKVKRGKRWKVRNLAGIIGALIGFILLSLFFITAALNRYNVFSAVLVWLLALILAYDAMAPGISRRAVRIFWGASAILLCFQTFFYIDPLSNLIFLNLDSGKGTVLSTDMKTYGYGDTMVNNYRYSFLDKLLDKMLQEVDYDNEMQIMVLGEKDNYSISGMTNRYELVWDTVKKKRVCKSIPDYEAETVPVNLLPVDDLEANAGEGIMQKAVIYFIKYCDYDEESYIKRLEPYYNIGQRQEISNWGGTLSYYVLERKF